MEKKSESELLMQGEENESEKSSKVSLIDGVKKRIDYVLVYEKEKKKTVQELVRQWCSIQTNESVEMESEEKRRKYEEKLTKLGMKLETTESSEGNLMFVKIHMPWECLCKWAEELHVKLPIKDPSIKDPSSKDPSSEDLCTSVVIRDLLGECANTRTMNEKPVTVPFKNALKDSHFKINREDPDKTFTSSMRIKMAYNILNTVIAKDDAGFNIAKLLTDGVYKAAYPLHDCSHKSEEGERFQLYQEWVHPRSFFKTQPLHRIREYYGEKIGIYFAWLGFYTRMLAIPAMVGLGCFIYGLTTLRTTTWSKEVCDPEIGGAIVMCPQCDRECPYWRLNSTCATSKALCIFDNFGTLVFAAFMSVWAMLFPKMWKRYQATLHWDTTEFSEPEELVHHEYLDKCKQSGHERINPVTLEKERVPYTACEQLVVRLSIGKVGVLFGLLVILAMVVAMYVYCLAVFLTLSDQRYSGSNSTLLTPHTFTSVTASIINFIAITILNIQYKKLAMLITTFEIPRTKTDYENSLTMKIFLLQCVNSYSACFYIAFIKGKAVGYPGEPVYILEHFRKEECGPQGCMMELTIQLAVILSGNAILKNIQEILISHAALVRLVKNLRRRCCTPWDMCNMCHTSVEKTRWEQDYQLLKHNELEMIHEYLEMVIQFGFVTLFAVSFPLAPVLALINNLVEIRIDAWKISTQRRRMAPEKAQDIGAWMPILQGITKFAVVTNVMIMAFTSDMIPRQVYYWSFSVYPYGDSSNPTMEGYINKTLSVFNIEDFTNQSKPTQANTPDWFSNSTTCRYRGSRYPPGHPLQYEYNNYYWLVLTARLTVFVVVVLILYFAKSSLSYAIPDVPEAVRVQIKREQHRIELAFKALDEKDKEEEVSELTQGSEQGTQETEESGNQKTEGPCLSPQVSELTQGSEQGTQETKESGNQKTEGRAMEEQVQLKKVNKQLADSEEHFRAKNKELEKTKTEKTQQERVLNQQRGDAKQQLADSEERLRAKDTELEETKAEKTKRERVLNQQLGFALEKLADSKERLQAKNKELEKTKAEKTQQERVFSQQLGDAKQELADSKERLQAKNKELEKTKAEKTHQERVFSQQLGDAKQELADSKERLQDKNKELEKTKAEKTRQERDFNQQRGVAIQQLADSKERLQFKNKELEKTKVPSHVVLGTHLKDEKMDTVKQKGSLTPSSSTAEVVKPPVMEDTPPEKKDLDEERDIKVCLRGRGKHREMEDTPKETKDLDEERDRRRVKHATEMPEGKSEWTLFDPPFTPSDNPPIQSPSQPKSYPLDPIKHQSSTETPSTSSDSTLNRPHMVSSQRTQDRKRREELSETGLHSSNLPFFPSSTLSTSLNMSSLFSMPHLPRNRRKEAEIEESDIPSSQDVPQEVITPNMYPSVAVVSPMLYSSSTSQQSSHDSPEEMMSCDTACDLSTTDQPVAESLSAVHPSLELQDETDQNDSRMGESISLPRSHSLHSLSQIPCLENKTGFRAKRSHSVNDVTLLDKTQKFTPDIIVMENKESYRFHCTQTGLFQCNVTGLVFKMEAERDVTYRTVPWDRRLLSELSKRPAGPLFDIKGSQGSVCQLHFPHCEILSMGGGKSLYVLHVMDNGHIELIYPDVITETHVIINVNTFSPHGLVTDVDSTKQALVSLFYTPPIDDDDPISTLKVLLLPGNVVLDEVMTKRRKLVGEEIFIEKPPCELTPNQEYTLSVSPEDESIIIEPDKAKFKVDESSYHNYISTFEVILEGRFKRVRLLLRHSNPSICAWKGYVDLSTAALRKQQVQRTLTRPAEDRLFDVRSSFINSVSHPVLNGVLDELFQNKVIIKEEYDEARVEQVKHEKARFVIDTVMSKGTAASSSMIFILCETDQFFSKHLGLML